MCFGLRRLLALRLTLFGRCRCGLCRGFRCLGGGLCGRLGRLFGSRSRRTRFGLRRLGLFGHGTLGGLGRLVQRLHGGVLGREINLAEELRLLDLVLDVDHVALDDHLLLLFTLLFAGLFEGDGRLLLRDAFTNRFPGIHGAAVRAELLLQNGIGLGVDQRVGRPVALDALLLQEVRDGVQSDLELLGNLNES